MMTGLLAMAVPGVASAASLASCTASAAPVAFGNYNPLSSSDDLSSGSVTVSCNLILGISLLVSYTISLSAGGGSYSQRKLANGSSKLDYNLYVDNAMTSVWGDGTGGTATKADGYLLALPATLSYPVYGKMPAGQTSAIGGSYGDAIVVTVSY